MSDSEPANRGDLGEIRALFEATQRRLRRLTVAVALMTLTVVLLLACWFGDLANWYGNQGSLVGGAAAGAAVLGFVFGFFAGRRA